VAVILATAGRINASPCNHYSGTVVADTVRTVTVTLSAAELAEQITDDEVRAVLKLWARYQISRGKTLGQLVGKTIFPDIP
jgi:hypothetical protein